VSLQPRTRNALAGLSLSAAALVSLVVSESYTDRAVIPVPGDVPTIGFGTTSGVKLGDTIKPPQALARALTDIQKFEGALKQCVKVPLSQNEYDAYLQLSYNIGSNAFCTSTLVRKLNAGDYAGACSAIKSWDKFKGKPLRGLTLRREREYQQCITP
jgi:lysozyme